MRDNEYNTLVNISGAVLLTEPLVNDCLDLLKDDLNNRYIENLDTEAVNKTKQLIRIIEAYKMYPDLIKYPERFILEKLQSYFIEGVPIECMYLKGPENDEIDHYTLCENIYSWITHDNLLIEKKFNSWIDYSRQSIDDLETEKLSIQAVQYDQVKEKHHFAKNDKLLNIIDKQDDIKKCIRFYEDCIEQIKRTQKTLKKWADQLDQKDKNLIKDKQSFIEIISKNLEEIRAVLTF